jgi:lactate dehydrogenase-like 2-hydroxyacid dehydrogenase
LLQALPAVELVACVGVGFDAIDLDYAREHGIAVTTTPGVLDNCVADTALALLLAVFVGWCRPIALSARVIGRMAGFR